MEIPLLISDLAVMMLTAGIITILFRRIKQPLVLGYILAGFLMSPYFPLFMTVEDMGSIHTWSEIGIIFLMFHLGLEFNLHKLAQVGSTAIVTTIRYFLILSFILKILPFRCRSLRQSLFCR